MTRKNLTWLGVAFAVGILAGGLPLWPIPYSEVNMTASTLPLFWAVGAGIGAIFIAGISPLGYARSALAVALGVPAAVFMRVIAEGIQDPTSHNLWPIELLLSLMIVALPAITGASIGHLAQRTVKRRANRGGDL